MKRCKDCGAVVDDDSRFCNVCGSGNLEFADKPFEQNGAPIPPPPPAPGPMPSPGPMPAPGPMPVPPPQFQPVPIPRKPEFTKFDLFTIFGFVASLVGLFEISLILEPLALITAILGFAKGKRNRGLAIAGIVVAGIGLIVRLFRTLYDIGVIPKWLITGSFD